MVVARVRLVHGAILHAMHTGIYGIRLDDHTGRQQDGESRADESRYSFAQHDYLSFAEIQIVDSDRGRRRDSANEDGSTTGRRANASVIELTPP